MYSRGKTIAKLVNSLSQFSCQQEVGDILITATRDNAYNGTLFSQALTNFRKNILRRLFAKGVSIVTRSDRNRLHCHIAAQMPSKCVTFDWTSFEQAEHYYRLFKQYRGKTDLQFYRYFTTKYRRSLPQDWQDINRKLMLAGKKYGLGRVFLTPVRKNMTALKWYFVGNIPYHRDTRDEGIHYLVSWGMTAITNFQVYNKYTTEYRNRLRKFCTGLQLDSNNYNITLRSVLGRRWHYKIKDIIHNIDKLSTNQSAQYNELRNIVDTHILRSQ